MESTTSELLKNQVNVELRSSAPGDLFDPTVASTRPLDSLNINRFLFRVQQIKPVYKEARGVTPDNQPVEIENIIRNFHAMTSNAPPSLFERDSLHDLLAQRLKDWSARPARPVLVSFWSSVKTWFESPKQFNNGSRVFNVCKPKRKSLLFHLARCIGVDKFNVDFDKSQNVTLLFFRYSISDLKKAIKIRSQNVYAPPSVFDVPLRDVFMPRPVKTNAQPDPCGKLLNLNSIRNGSGIHYRSFCEIVHPDMFYAPEHCVWIEQIAKAEMDAELGLADYDRFSRLRSTHKKEIANSNCDFGKQAACCLNNED